MLYLEAKPWCFYQQRHPSMNLLSVDPGIIAVTLRHAPVFQASLLLLGLAAHIWLRCNYLPATTGFNAATEQILKKCPLWAAIMVLPKKRYKLIRRRQVGVKLFIESIVGIIQYTGGYKHA
jgi:hypothetical protein